MPSIDTPKVWYEWILLALKRATDVRGRASRAEYWWFTVIFLVVSFDISGAFYAIICIPALTVTVRRLHDLNWSGWWAALAPLAWNFPVALMALYGTFEQQMSGSFDGLPKLTSEPLPLALAILALFSVLVTVIAILLFQRPGTSGDNRFGPDPLPAPENPTTNF